MLKTITSFVDSLGSLTYKGLWNAATNTPTLASGVGTTGDYYVVSVPGTTTLDGISSWAAGDWAIFNGSVWEKYNNPADTLGEVLANGNTTAGTDISVTTGDDITFADNSKAIFGAGSDLQIYHDGSDSYIDDQGTGPIRIRSGVGGALRFQDLDGDDLINATSNGAVTLYYDNSAKLATTATGIDVTGSVTADGLTAGNTSAAYSAVYIISSATGESELRMGDTDSDAGSIAYTNSDDTMTFRAAAGARMTLDSTGIDVTGSVTADGLTASASTADYIASITNSNGTDAGGGLFVSTRWNTNANSVAKFVSNSGSNVVANFAGNGDISFYEDTGTTPKFFWDASAELLGIGNSAPTTTLDVTGSITSQSSAGYATATLKADTSNSGSGGTPELRFELGGTQKARFRVDTSDNVEIATGTGAGSTRFGIASNGDISFYNAAATSQSFFWDASAESLGIGTSSPSTELHVLKSDSDADVTIEGTGTGVDARLNLYANSTGVSQIRFGDEADTNIGLLTYDHSDDSMQFRVNDSERMRIDASGNLLVGKTSVSFGTAGIELKNSNVISITRSANPCLNANRIGSSAGSLIIMHYDGVDVGSIDVTASATSYTTSSDQRLKENIADADDAGSKIDAIQVRKFDWKVDGSHQDYGMVAQELLEVAPEAVSQGETEDDMMGVDYSKLVPMMLKEIQSLRARVATLEGNPPQETTTTERVIV